MSNQKKLYKQYRLIKTYPNSPNLGTFAHNPIVYNRYDLYVDEKTEVCICFADINTIENYPEYWQEIIEKEYEILSFVSKNGTIFTKRPSENFISKGSKDIISTKIFDEKYQLSRNNSIHSVKRLSDEEIFTVGDEITYNNLIGYSQPIKSIEIVENDGIKFDVTLGYIYLTLENCKAFHSKKKLFTTEDGIDVYVEDIIFHTNRNLTYPIYKTTAIPSDTGSNKDFIYFSTREKAEEYIIYNKPCLSLKDLLTSRLLNSYTDNYLINISIPLIKSKLNL